MERTHREKHRPQRNPAKTRRIAWEADEANPMDTQSEEDYHYERAARHSPRDNHFEDYEHYVAPHHQGSSEYREELDRHYPRQGRREVLAQMRSEQIEQETRSYAGRGPRQYARPDYLILDEINGMLNRNSSVDAENIIVEVKEGNVQLSGDVPERRMKHIAEDIAEACYGVKEVTNTIKVVSPT